MFSEDKQGRDDDRRDSSEVPISREAPEISGRNYGALLMPNFFIRDSSVVGLMPSNWLAAVCLHCEHGFRRVKGFRKIAAVVRNIEAEQASTQQDLAAA